MGNPQAALIFSLESSEAEELEAWEKVMKSLPPIELESELHNKAQLG